MITSFAPMNNCVGHGIGLQLQLQLRRRVLTALTFGTDLSYASSDSAMTEPMLVCTLLLLQIPHSLVCQKAVTVSINY